MPIAYSTDHLWRIVSFLTVSHHLSRVPPRFFSADLLAGGGISQVSVVPLSSSLLGEQVLSHYLSILFFLFFFFLLPFVLSVL